MSSHPRLAAALLLACVVCSEAGEGVAQTVRRQMESLEKKLLSNDSLSQWQAVRGYTRLGLAAVPNLLKLLETAGSKAPEARTAELAARALGDMGRDAIGAIPRLEQLLEDGTETQGRLALRVLGRVGPYDSTRVAGIKEAVASYIARRRTARDTVSQRRKVYAEVGPCLARLEIDLDSGVDPKLLQRNVARWDATLRTQAAELLTRSGNRNKTGVESIRKALLDSLMAIKQPRNTAFKFELGGEIHEVVAATHREEDVRSALALALLEISGRQAGVPMEVHTALLRHPDPARRQASALALGALGEKAAKAVPDLVRSLDDSEATVVWEAITALGMIGPPAKKAQEALERLAGAEDRAKAARAAAALKRIGGT